MHVEYPGQGSCVLLCLKCIKFFKKNPGVSLAASSAHWHLAHRMPFPTGKGLVHSWGAGRYTAVDSLFFHQVTLQQVEFSVCASKSQLGHHSC